MSTSNDSKPARPARRNLNLASPPDSALDRIAVLYGDQDLNLNVASVLERYLVMLHRATPKFSDREICVVIDALGDSWEPTPTNIGQIPREVLTAIITDRLDAKWGIDTDKFSSRLDRTSFYERTTLAEITPPPTGDSPPPTPGPRTSSARSRSSSAPRPRHHPTRGHHPGHRFATGPRHHHPSVTQARPPQMFHPPCRAGLSPPARPPQAGPPNALSPPFFHPRKRPEKGIAFRPSKKGQNQAEKNHCKNF